MLRSVASSPLQWLGGLSATYGDDQGTVGMSNAQRGLIQGELVSVKVRNGELLVVPMGMPVLKISVTLERGCQFLASPAE